MGRSALTIATPSQSDGITCIDVPQLLLCRQRLVKRRQASLPIASRSGQYFSAQKGRGMEFAEVRDYRPGDDVRHIDWRTTAKTGKTHVKRYHQDKEQPWFLVIDFNPSMYFGTRNAFKSVVAAKMAAYMASAAVCLGDPVGGLVLHPKIAYPLSPRTGNRGLLPLLGAISQASATCPDEKIDICHAALRVRRLARSGAKVIVLSDFNQSLRRGDWLDTIKRCQLLAVVISDPLEKQAPPPGYYPITDGQRQVILNSHRGDLNQHLQQQHQQLIGRVHHCFGQTHTLEVSTEDDLGTVADHYLASSHKRSQYGSL